jgi:hypothetical protein
MPDVGFEPTTLTFEAFTGILFLVKETGVKRYIADTTS